jgi:polar amino acid transport system substrate-binding protein
MLHFAANHVGRSLKERGKERMRSTRLSPAIAFATALALVGAGCGTNNSDTTSSPASTGGSSSAPANPTATPGINVSQDQKIASEVPSSISSKGTLTVAADATYAPMEFVANDGKTIEGADADLAKALGQVMGLNVQVQNAGFDSILPGLAANKYDLGMSSFTITKERLQTVDFVSYLIAGTSFYVPASGGPDVKSLADLCGTTVAVERGTIQATASEQQSKKCTQNGDDPVKTTVYPDQNGANLAISSGRANVGMADSPVAAYIVTKSNGQFKLTGGSFGDAPYGIAIPKGNGMAKPVQAAMQELMDNGTYTKILDYWGISQGAIKKAEIDPQNVPAS